MKRRNAHFARSQPGPELSLDVGMASLLDIPPDVVKMIWQQLPSQGKHVLLSLCRSTWEEFNAFDTRLAVGMGLDGKSPAEPVPLCHQLNLVS